ncbi:MAG: class I SAM-dependent methyltransferase [Oscillospiraceae bacterium]|jgi:2-polyprenyl-3-methyl-5-hydroxy-6-metoxy-1,4-benzoquinol methylase|nr:class I SAM-dependent methyltransferase [Oscillospiraceae bacterium]
MQNLFEQFNRTTELIENECLEEALEILLNLKMYTEMAPFCYYRIAQISNMIGEPDEAYDLFYKALELMPDIASKVLPDDHPSLNYIFRGKKVELEIMNCTLCGGESENHWCYPLFEASGYNEHFNPIRMWRYCEKCHHIFARNFPEKPFIYADIQKKPNPRYFSYYSNILSNIRKAGFTAGMSLFEVGIGAGECLLAAREIGYETYGIDVINRQVEEVKSRYGLDVETADFNEYIADREWDIIMMGDVIEHVNDPEAALAKAVDMMADDGALWISTPSFESAYSLVLGHTDAMRRETYHINYFSRQSLYELLERNYLFPVDYQISDHYAGSMEVVAKKI